MSRNVIETVMGGVVLLVAAFFLVFAYTSANLGSVNGYDVTARFANADGLSVGTDVRISGVRVGSVVEHRLDPETFMAEVRLSIDPTIELPADTVAVIASEGLLGGRYMRLDVGGDPETIPADGRIIYTQSTPGLEQLIGQAIYGLQSGGDSGNATGAGESGTSVPSDDHDGNESFPSMFAD
ncbi:outer membrane lipid asymmetry maintenance protein MlaD [Fodinicurvata sp. EGI_FJ10296]|uniref:outer membrane lipid asymmetry maintenance protein MlaD n=1 Tax=Fodinicurvata sp. EGI_FJ10296 TaxID=3231908 RepID=UPI0034555C95